MALPEFHCEHWDFLKFVALSTAMAGIVTLVCSLVHHLCRACQLFSTGSAPSRLAAGSLDNAKDLDETVYLFNAMAGVGSTSLLMTFRPCWRPERDLTEIRASFQDFPGFLDLRMVRIGLGRRRYIITFSTTEDAANALAQRSQVVITGRTRYVSFYEEPSTPDEPQVSLMQQSRLPEPTEEEAPRKRQKIDEPKCHICFSELKDQRVSTPCRSCKHAWCFTCVEKQFTVALGDVSRMPVTCCFMVMHPDVANGIITKDELELYKHRFDENNTVNPLFCPVPTCSTFIPPRKFNKNGKKANCTTCKTVICTQCKEAIATSVPVNDGKHECAKTSARTEIMETFQYKTCPKCGSGIMRMFGCAHIRCKCGAHWCWDCQRPMTACYRNPCSESRSNYDWTDDGEPDSDDENQVERTIADADATVASTPAETANNVPTNGAAAADTVDVAAATRGADSEEVVENITDATDSGPAPAPELPQPTDNPDPQETPEARPRLRRLTSADVQQQQSEPEESSASLDADVVVAQPIDSATQQLPSESATNNDTPPVDGGPENDAPAVEGNTENNTSETTAEQAQEDRNLDDPDAHDFELMQENEEIDFGMEPLDENFDVWGCRHRFREFVEHLIPENWLAGMDANKDLKEVECMLCFENAKVFRSSDQEGVRTKKEKNHDWSWDCSVCGVVVCGRCRLACEKRMRKDRKERKA